MWPSRYFGARYWPARYWGKSGATVIILYGVTAAISDVRELGTITDARELGAMTQAARELGAIS